MTQDFKKEKKAEIHEKHTTNDIEALYVILVFSHSNWVEERQRVK